MIKIYLSPSCLSCRKVKAWFEEQQIPFKEINIMKTTLSENELKEMLMKSLDGADEIISTRSKVFKEQGLDVDTMSVSELVKFIQVGYNADEIEIFERNKKQIASAKEVASHICTPENCPNYDSCVHHFNDKHLAKAIIK